MPMTAPVLPPAEVPRAAAPLPRRPGDDSRAWLALTALLGLGAVAAFVATGAEPALAGQIEWRPGLGASEPWRWWTAAWLHWSGAHLGVNLLGAAVIGFVGWRARLAREAAIAWLLAWPLTHALMALPDAALVARTLGHYGGLSGVLHAGVVVLALHLVRTRPAATPPSPPKPDAPATRPPAPAPRATEGPWAMTSLDELSAWQRLDEAPPGHALSGLSDAEARRHRWVGLALLAGVTAKVLLEAPWDLALRPDALLGIQVAPLAHACGIAAGVIAWGLVETLAAAARRRATPGEGSSQ